MYISESTRGMDSIANIQWQTLAPNEHGDWLNLRNDTFSSFISIGDKETKSFNTFFTSKYSSGLKLSSSSVLINIFLSTRKKELAARA